MAGDDLVFKTTSDLETVYDPIEITPTLKGFRVTNYGSTDLDDLGFYIRPSTSLGDVDAPAEYPPETDYQDLLTWGSNVDAGVDTVGGIIIRWSATNHRITRDAGSVFTNRIDIGTITAGSSFDFEVKLELPTSVTPRRFYVDLCLE